ncbi:hypothetical protein EGI26_12490 [Lacihabitans sp. CCS-44]|nr:hypothetical protein [Lacihabitans sp. CCS-44]
MSHLFFNLYYLKYAKKGFVANNIDNFYQVCCQTEKSLKWKHKEGRHFFNYLFKRKQRLMEGNCKWRQNNNLIFFV